VENDMLLLQIRLNIIVVLCNLRPVTNFSASISWTSDHL